MEAVRGQRESAAGTEISAPLPKYQQQGSVNLCLYPQLPHS